MTKDKAKLIVESIASIAQGQAAIELCRCFESTNKAVENTKIVENWKAKLIEILIETL